MVLGSGVTQVFNIPAAAVFIFFLLRCWNEYVRTGKLWQVYTAHTKFFLLHFLPISPVQNGAFHADVNSDE